MGTGGSVSVTSAGAWSWPLTCV